MSTDPKPTQPEPTHPEPTHPELRAELLARADRDQQVRRADDGDALDVAAMTEVDADNLVFLAPLLDRYGWLDTRMVGQDGAHACWLLVQHSPGAEQDRRLPALRDAVARDTASRRDLAYLQDRVDTHHDRPQTYGTQYLGFPGDRAARLLPVRDPATVNVLREQLGLAPIDDHTLATAWTEHEIHARRRDHGILGAG